jgi:hypothetical protein
MTAMGRAKGRRKGFLGSGNARVRVLEVTKSL